jgi:arylsulfatase A-like enzyme
MDTGKETQFYSMLGTRAIRHKGWKAVTAVPAGPSRRYALMGPFPDDSAF